MAKAKEIIVQESLEELQKYLRRASCPTIKKRIKMLIVIKKRSPEMLSKNELAKLSKCNHNSINTWRRLYIVGGMDAITQHKWTGTKSKHISEEQHQQMAEKLSNPSSNFISDTTKLLSAELITATCRYDYIIRAISDYF